LLLACLGIFGVMAYSASLRRKEISIRMALGATRSSLLVLLMTQSARPAVCGMLAGFVVSGIASHILKSQNIHLGSLDAPVLISVGSILALSCALAAMMPAWRAIRADIAETLRND